MKRYLMIMLTVCAMMMAADVQGQPLVKTHVETGDIEGVIDGTLAVYKAIPYAAPPVGNLRWKAPQPPKPWEGVLKTDKFGPLPPQPTRPGRTADMMSEDCLYLGIATPARSVADKLPVMVWIHGGGFQTEHYGGDLWKHLAMRGVVIAKDIRATMVCWIRSSPSSGCSATSRTSVVTPLALPSSVRVRVPSAVACFVHRR